MLSWFAAFVNFMSKKIYIIEDDANILYSLQAKFSAEGFQTAADAGNSYIFETINAAKAYAPDFIILDLILPKFDGFDLIRSLREREETKSIPIFVFTNLSDKDSKARGLNLGADYYFIKEDFGIDQFVGKVRKIIENKDRVTRNA